jgi:tRNA G18 (ribose-2'-O)-methylase SpoU
MFCTFVLEFVGNNYYINILIMARKKSMLELHRVDVEQYRHVSKLPVTVVLDNVRSEMNVGSVFRTADAFLIERIMLCGITPRPPKPEIHKTALGAEESVDWQYYATTVEAIEQLKGEGYMICSIEQVHDSVSLDQFALDPGTRVAIVMGNEVKGVGQEVVDMSDQCVEIPQHGTKHSLNISCCAAIVMWHIYRLLKP